MGHAIIDMKSELSETSKFSTCERTCLQDAEASLELGIT